MATASTDQSGNASFTVTQLGQYTVSAAKVGYQTSPASTINVQYSGQTFTITLQEHPATGYTITIHVQDQQGIPVQGATVAVT